MSSLTELQIGSILTSPQCRDAIHVAVYPIQAGEHLSSGDRVKLLNNKAVKSTTKLNTIGIVDPFLEESVREDDWFWLFLLPGTVRSLRHEWSHSAFESMDKSVEWLKRYAADVRSYEDEKTAYDNFLIEAKAGRISYYGSDCHSLDDVHDADELFAHLSVVLGRPVNAVEFSYNCSC